MDSKIAGFITCLLCGLLVGGCGLYMLITGNPRIMHGYHYATVAPAQMRPLARWAGAGLLVCGVGCALIVPPAGMSDWIGIAGIALLVVGLGLTFGSIMHFNGALFSFGPNESGPPRAATVAIGVLLAVVICLVTVIPGAMMIFSGDPSALHGYHLVHVAEADRPTLATWVGAGTIALGLGLGLDVAAGFCGGRRPMPTWAKVLLAVGLVGFAAGLAVMLGAIIHFNGSLMG